MRRYLLFVVSMEYAFWINFQLTGLISYNTRFSGRYRFGSYGRPNPKNTLSSEEAVHGAMKELATGRDLFWRCDEMSGDNVVRVFSIHEWLGIVERSGKSPDTALKNAGYPPLASLKTIKERTVAGELEVIGVIGEFAGVFLVDWGHH